MSRLCNINIKNREEIYKKLRRFLSILREKYYIDKVYIYGSFAKNEIHEGSDIDLLIIGDFSGKIFERISEVLSLTDLPIEPLVYNTSEFKRESKTNSFIKEIIRTGKRF